MSTVTSDDLPIPRSREPHLLQQDMSGLAWVYSRGVWVHFCPCTQLLVWEGPGSRLPSFC